ncbi:MAG: TIGR03546 family protein [Endomicrobiales bacterium]
MFWLKIFKGLIKVLHSEISPNEIAGGVSLGAIIGLTPFNTLHNYFIFLLILVLKVNIGAAMLSMALFGLAGYFLDPLAQQTGYFLLVKSGALTGVWTTLYNLPIVPFTRFNNTVVLGSLVISLVLFVPVFILTVRLIVLYRARWRAKVEKWGIVKWLKLSPFYNLYDKYK